jgi:putative transcriptional regulator
MTIVRKTYDLANLPLLTDAERAQIAAVDLLSDAELTARAESDPDNPPLTEDELERLRMVAAVRAARHRAGLSQTAFARAYRFTLGRLRDLEQGRTKPDGAVLAYLSLIERDPDGVREALG